MLSNCRRARKAGPSQAALQAAGAARTALRAQCTEVSLETVERYNLLRKFLAMLPASQQSTHDAAVMARQHVEYLDATVMAQSLSKASDLHLLKPNLSCSAALNLTLVISRCWMHANTAWEESNDTTNMHQILYTHIHATGNIDSIMFADFSICKLLN